MNKVSEGRVGGRFWMAVFVLILAAVLSVIWLFPPEAWPYKGGNLIAMRIAFSAFFSWLIICGGIGGVIEDFWGKKIFFQKFYSGLARYSDRLGDRR